MCIYLQSRYLRLVMQLSTEKYCILYFKKKCFIRAPLFNANLIKSEA